MAVRAPHLYNALRYFSLGAFRMLLAELKLGVYRYLAATLVTQLGVVQRWLRITRNLTS